MKIVITGSGALGCRFGAAFADAGMDIWLHDVWEEHINVIKNSGLLIYNGIGNRRTFNTNAVTNISKAPQADILMICTKAMMTGNAAAGARPVVNEKTVILTMQNGLNNIEKIANEYPDNPIIAGVTYYTGDLIGPGEVVLKSNGFTRLMALSEQGRNTAETLVRSLQETGHNAEISEDIFKDIWEKAAFNAALDTVTALTGLTIGAAGSMPQSRSLLFSIASEVVTVAHMEGINACEAHVYNMIENIFDPLISGSYKILMLRDRITKRPTEICELCGQIIEIAKKHGEKVPYNQAVYTLMCLVENNYNIDEMYLDWD